jgi:glycerophosphoryl diester phosphodiesterase
MTFLIFGHRGSPKRFPENTVASFEEALRNGADGFETDLRLLADRTPILFHDDDLGDTAIESLTAADLASITRVSDLQRFAGRTTMILEVKRGGWEDVLCSAIESWPDIVVISFDHESIAELSRRNVAFPRGILFEGRIVDVAAYAESVGATWIFPSYRFIDRELVDSLHERGLKCIAWTPNRRGEWDALRDMGCDGVITDLPDDCVRWRSELHKV